MKKFYVIEADTEFYSVFVREVTQSFEFTNEVRYVHSPGAKIALMDIPGKGFGSKLEDLLVTRGSLECTALIVQNCEDQWGELCRKPCEPGQHVCVEHLTEGVGQ